MIVLDEQLLGRGIETLVARWYPGRVCFITDLRPGTIIKDEAIPALLHAERECTFATINESDFWRKVAITANFCVVCIAVPDDQADKVSEMLRAVLQIPAFRTKAGRSGRVIRATQDVTQFYDAANRVPREP